MKIITALSATLLLASHAFAQAPATSAASAPAPVKPVTPAPAAAPATPAAPTPPPAPAFAPANLTPAGVRSMSATCSSCHGTNGVSAGGAIAGLAGLNRDYFIIRMKSFKEGKREATLMHQIAKGYTDAEVAAMADYFAAQKR
ncbi:MAG: c-type cytochrome [Burkholderiales bacterium]|jgi:sulfide dehydrogenase cytochrome subunit|nr:c-type cytochrome [Betaproteobacteria bacterium]